jgi:hypothetical protein
VVGCTRSAYCEGDDYARYWTSNMTHANNVFDDKCAWPQYHTVRSGSKDIQRTQISCSWILFRLVPCPPKGANNAGKEWHSEVGTVLSPLRNLDITCPSLKCNCSDGFQRQCYPLLAAWVGDYPEEVIVDQVSWVSCPMCEIPLGALIGYSTFRPLDNSRDQHVYLVLLVKHNNDILRLLVFI